MNYGLNPNQAALAGISPQQYSYAQPMVQQPVYYPQTSYTVPVQQQMPMPAPSLKADNYESTRDKNVGDFAAGVFVGAGKAIYDMGHGLYFLGKTAGNAVLHPVNTLKNVGGAVLHGVTHPIQTAEFVVSLPFKVAKGIVKPYSNAIQQGRYGEAVGRLTVDVTMIAAAFGGNKPPGGAPPATPTPVTPPPAASTVDDIATVVDKVDNVAQPLAGVGGGATNNVTNTIGDTILEKIVNLEGATIQPGATVNINIGNIEVGKQVVSGTVNATSGGGGLGKVISNADELASVVTPITQNPVAQAMNTVTPAMTETVASVSSVVNQSRTVGTVIGGGIDKIIQLPGKIGTGISNGLVSIGNGIQNVGKFIANPLQGLQGLDLVKAAEWAGNGLRTGADLTAKGLLFAAQNPKQAAIIAGAVGRAGKATEDVMMEFDLVR